MSRPRAMVLAAPGTNRDHDVAFALELAGADPRSRCSRNCSPNPAPLLRDTQMLVLAGGFSYADALGAGRMWSLGVTAPPRRRAPRLRRRRQPGHRHLQRLPGAHPHRPAAGRARPQRERPLPVRVGAPGGTRQQCVWTRDLDPIECPIAHGEGRYVHPDLAALAAAGQVALRVRQGARQPQRLGRRHRRRVRRDRAGARPDAAPREPRHRPPAPAPRAWHRGGLGLALFEQGVRYAGRSA